MVMNMGKRVIDVWKLSLSELYFVLAAVLAAGAIGVALEILIIGLDDTVTSYPTLGTFMAIILSALVFVFAGIFTYGNMFNTAVAFGCTRKEFMLASSLATLMDTVIIFAVVGFFYMVERVICNVLYKDLEYENIIQYLLDYRVIVGMLIFIPILRMLFGALVLKFQKWACWGLWVLWMLGSLGAPRLGEYMENNPDSIATGILQNVLSVMTDMSGAAWVIVLSVLAILLCVIAVALLRKQEVTG